MITEDLKRSVSIWSFPHKAIRGDLTRGADYSLKNLIEGRKEPGICSFFFSPIREPERLSQLIPIEAQNDFFLYYGDRELAQPQGFKLRSGVSVILYISTFKDNTVLRKKLFR